MKKILLLIAIAGLTNETFSQAPNWLWAKSAGGISSDRGTDIATDASGNVLVTGDFSSSSAIFGTTTLANAGGYDMFIAKYDGSGNVLWAKREGGTSDDRGNGITTDASGNVLVTGNFKSDSMTFGATVLINLNPFFSDLFIAKYDTGGNILWAKSAGGTHEDVGNSIITDAGGNVFVAGWFRDSISFGTITLTGAGVDFFVVKYDAGGNVLWAKNGFVFM